MFLSTKFERSIWPRILAPLLAATAVAVAANRPAQADVPAIYVISDSEGYGVVECITQNRECGRIVADSWCEAHGHGMAKAFGRADDITASIGSSAPRPEQGAAIVACNE